MATSRLVVGLFSDLIDSISFLFKMFGFIYLFIKCVCVSTYMSKHAWGGSEDKL